MIQRVGASAPGDVKRAFGAAPAGLPAVAALHPLEIGQHVCIAPAVGPLVGPMVEVFGMTADVDHAVDRRRAADHFAARADQLPAAEMRFRLRSVAPIVMRHVHRVGQGGRHLDQRPHIGAAVFQHQHRVRAGLAQARGHRRSRRAGPHDDEISLGHWFSHGWVLLAPAWHRQRSRRPGWQTPGRASRS